MAVEPVELTWYLDELFGRLVDHRFASDIDVSDLVAPVGVNAVLLGDSKTHRVHTARVFLDPPMTATELGRMVERRVDVADGSSRLLVAVDETRLGPLGPSRVTVGLPTSVLDGDVPIEQLVVMLPDQFTSPTGVQYAVSVSEDWGASIDLRSVLPDDGVLRRLHDLLGGSDDVTGLLWCDDAADMFGTPRYGSTSFGMPPHFIPLIDVGVDGMVLGLLWDAPETGVLGDTTLFVVSPGGRFRLESKVSLKGWIAMHVRHELGHADDERSKRLEAVLELVGKRTKSAALGMGSGVKRSKPRDLGDGERWVPLVYGGDGVRAPATTFGVAPIRFCADGRAGLAASRDALAAAAPGSALHAAASGFTQAVAQPDAAAMQALYHAMIEPLERLGRGVIADRCRAITNTVVPIVCDQPTPPESPPPVWSVPMPGERTAFDVHGDEHQKGPLRVELAADVVTVDVDRLAPLEATDLPTPVLVAVLDSGAVAVSQEGRFASEHGRRIFGARSGEHYVVVSVEDQPPAMRFSVEAVVPWSDDGTRSDVVQYVPFQVSWDPLDVGSVDAQLLFRTRVGRRGGSWPLETSIDALRAAGPRAGPDAHRIDVLHADATIHGIVVSERAASLLADGVEHYPLVLDAPGGSLDFRYVPLPVSSDFDWDRSTFVVVAGNSSKPTIVERLGGSPDIDALRAMNTESAMADGPNLVARPNVIVLGDAPPIMRLFGPGIVVRSDIRDAANAAGLVGPQMGHRSGFYVVPISD